MCGIAGILRKDGPRVQEDELLGLTQAMTHRGPDGYGVHMDDHVGLGHRRLAIIDLEGGVQPMCNEDESIWVVLNGEIYNFSELSDVLTASGHKFKTRSDTEVLVHGYEEWGVGCLERLRGMFAFAIWDARQRRLFLARDRVGIKPLCYMSGPHQFAFASELQAFRTLNDFRPSLDLEALDIYLHFQYIPAPYSIYREVRKLPPGHYMTVDSKGRITGPKRYWDIEFRPDHSLDEAEWVERLDAGLQEAVKLHLVSDVPFGAFLSGGVDSSAVVAYMSQVLDQPVRTFTIGYDEAECDEREYARQAADDLRTQHHETVVRLEGLDLLPTLVEHYGEPFADSSAICTYYVSQVASQHVKMVLSGDGGDETFAGYGYFHKMLRRHRKPKGLMRRARGALGAVVRAAGLRQPAPTPQETWYHRTPYLTEAQRRQLWRPDYLHLLEHTREWNDAQFEPAKGKDLLSQCQYVDIHNYLCFDNLNKVDIASMCHGLEVRVPLLDHVFLEMVAAVPAEMKLRAPHGSATDLADAAPESVITKYILRKTSERFLRPGFHDRPKRGFSVPIAAWLAGPWHRHLLDRLTDPAAGLGDLFNLDFVVGMVHEHVEQRTHGHRLWALLFLAEWMTQNHAARAAG